MSELKTAVDARTLETAGKKGFLPGFFGALFRIILFLLIAATALIFMDQLYYQNRVYPGIKIENYYAGGKHSDELRSFLRDEMSSLLNNKYIHFPKREDSGDYLAVTFADAGIEAEWEAAIKKALNLGRTHTFLGFAVGDPVLRYQLYQERPSVSVDMSFNEEKIHNMLIDLNNAVKILPENAYAGVKDDEVYIMREKTGLKLDYEKTMENIVNLWDRFLWGRDNARPFHVEAVLRPLLADVTYRDLREININTVVAEFTTFFDARDTNRNYNIKLAAEKIHNSFLLPGESFSFNEVVGKANEAAGYLSAPIIADGELVQGIGGGVCQVSTTLYNTVLQSGMNITERYPHSQPVSYVEEGFDAAISYPYKDLKFENSFSYPVIIAMHVDTNHITTKMYGPEKLLDIIYNSGQENSEES